MRIINYDKLMNFIRSNPQYEFRETEGTVELLFHAPSEEEAAGTEDVNDEAGPMIIVLFTKRGDELVPREAWIERGGSRQRMSVDELDTWLEFVDMYT
ncbi:hypothetical protein [Vulcanisaeta souniana]|uniref:Uncharacterized protein n=1 Tax=Vulcanisaeta souniana JCM 11219 TaxID=1293586 RepID=A0A830E505_9CREN|nr:hypothetical protein [Vulcanisaeta souniana]BDR92557.1 hypothetical protein Vsou_16500 [Vulcanisaeta souniana JCM 11219]GGI82960.1 hypothetical protein GCM10007112_19660 [Vulcanisaeta souniana JCM 11219]